MISSLMSDWRAWLALVSGIIAVISVVPYIRSMLAGKARPDFVTWFLWALTSGIGAAAQYSSGASWSISVVIGNTIATGIIALLALGYGTKKYTYIDTGSFAIAIFAVILWALSSDPLVALLLAICADFVAAIPTLLKAHKHPASEAPWTFFSFGFAALLAIIASQKYDLINLAYPMYFIFIYALIGYLAMKKRGRGRTIRR